MKYDYQAGITVYTCISGMYDKISPLSNGEYQDVSCICFSDYEYSAGLGWHYHTFESPRRLTNGHDINRYHKIFPQRVLRGCRYSVYVDGNIRYIGSYRKLVEEFRKSGAALGAFRHPEKRTIKEEAEACQKQGKFDKYDLARIDHQMEFYSEEGLNLNAPVTANYLLVRDNMHPRLQIAMSLWWSQLFEFTKRDQLSLNYVLWKMQVPWVFLDDLKDVHESDLVRLSHNRPIWHCVRSRLMKIYQSFWDVNQKLETK